MFEIWESRWDSYETPRVMSERRFPPPWTVETIPGGLKVCDANGQSLACVYSRENPNDAHMAKVLTKDEARRIASNSRSCRPYSAKRDEVGFGRRIFCCKLFAFGTKLHESIIVLGRRHSAHNAQEVGVK